MQSHIKNSFLRVLISQLKESTIFCFKRNIDFFCKESHAPYYLSFSCFCNFLAMKILQALISKGCAAICLGVSSGQINDKVFWVKVRMHIFQIIWRTFSRQKHPLTIFLKQKQNSYFHPECERRLRIKFLIIVPNPILYNIEIKCVHSMNVTNIMNWLVNWNSQRQSGLLLTTIETII